MGLPSHLIELVSFRAAVFASCLFEFPALTFKTLECVPLTKWQSLRKFAKFVKIVAFSRRAISGRDLEAILVDIHRSDLRFQGG